MPKTMIRPAATEPDEFEQDYYDLAGLAGPRDGSDELSCTGSELPDPEARVSKSVRSSSWCYYQPGEVRHPWAHQDRRKHPPKPSRDRK